MRGLAALVVLAAVLGAGAGPAAAELQPQMTGWEQRFTVQWKHETQRARTVVWGRVESISARSVSNLRVLVDGLDASGRVTFQQVALVVGDVLAFSNAYFEVPVAEAAAYRVRVYSYDPIETESSFL